MIILRVIRGCALALLGTVLLVLTVLFVLPDQAPSELSSQLHEKGRLDVGEPSDAFFYWMGFAADKDEDPYAFGRARVERYRHHLRSPRFSSSEFSESESVTLELASLSECSLANSTCVVELLNDTAQIDEQMAKAALIFNRYQQLMALEGHRNSLEPRLDEPLPPYGHLKQGNLALRLQVLKYVSLRQAELGVAQLLIDITRLRKLLVEENTLIGKTVYARLAAADIAMLMALQEHALLGTLPELSPISSEEVSLVKPLAREYVLFARVIAPLPDDPYLVSMDIAIPAMLRRLLFKEQHTLNLMAELTQSVLKDDGGPDSDGAKQSYAIGRWLDLLINPLGTQLAELAAPDVDRVQVALSALETQIQQFNHRQLQTFH